MTFNQIWLIRESIIEPSSVRMTCIPLAVALSEEMMLFPIILMNKQIHMKPEVMRENFCWF